MFNKYRPGSVPGTGKKKKTEKYKIYKISYSDEICFIMEAGRGEETSTMN